ncbi:hypothetical protein OG381_08035 [Streptomyces sp. NBC_00490]|uniref:hypothetical protein n=1 Tax=Streptomyces sp. NBC_00490 TaxID=2903657 RepID=UPI002E17B679
MLWFALGAAGAFVLALPVALWFDAPRAISLTTPSGTHVSGVSVPPWSAEPAGFGSDGRLPCSYRRSAAWPRRCG